MVFSNPVALDRLGNPVCHAADGETISPQRSSFQVDAKSVEAGILILPLKLAETSEVISRSVFRRFVSQMR